MLASATVIVLALVASWALAVVTVKLDYTPSFVSIAAAGLNVTALTVAVALLTSYGVGSKPSCELLREKRD